MIAVPSQCRSGPGPSLWPGLHSSWTCPVKTGVQSRQRKCPVKKACGQSRVSGVCGRRRGCGWGKAEGCLPGRLLARLGSDPRPWLRSAFFGQKEHPEPIFTSGLSVPPSPEGELCAAGCRRGLRTCCCGSGMKWWERVLDWRQREWKGEWSSKTQRRSGPWGVWWVSRGGALGALLTPGCRPEHLSRWCALQGEGTQVEEEEQLWGECREGADLRVGCVECEVTEQLWGVWWKVGDTGLEAEESSQVEECGGSPCTLCWVVAREQRAGHPWTSQHSRGPTETVKGGVEHEGHGWSWRDLGGQRIVGVRGQELGTKPCRRHRWPWGRGRVAVVPVQRVETRRSCVCCAGLAARSWKAGSYPPEWHHLAWQHLDTRESFRAV